MGTATTAAPIYKLQCEYAVTFSSGEMLMHHDLALHAAANDAATATTATRRVHATTIDARGTRKAETGVVTGMHVQ